MSSEERDEKPNLQFAGTSASQADPVTPRKTQGEKITIKFVNPNGEPVPIKMKATATFQKAFEAAASRFGYSINLIRFTYDGARLRPDQTPEEMEMVEDDTIDMHIQQIGGSV